MVGNTRVRNARVWLVRRTPLFWLMLSGLSYVGLFITWFWGVWSGGLDVAETCTLLRGQKYDYAYRAEHWREPTRAFPLHNKCNASYDLVPAWINPALVLFAAIAVGSLLAAVCTTVVWVRRFWRRRRDRQLTANGVAGHDGTSVVVRGKRRGGHGGMAGKVLLTVDRRRVRHLSDSARP
ncbi:MULTISPECIES: hypothetical protein [unclassified Streptomyces]|uniref:hypothetical protein n=1 Tax=unclassified Streptomyces TaxID=2593676 RepID=UPI00381D7967